MSSTNSHLSEAEIERAANIARNEEFMRSVGILDAVADAQAAAHGRKKNTASRAPRPKREKLPVEKRASSRNAGKEKKSYHNDLPPDQLGELGFTAAELKAERPWGEGGTTRRPNGAEPLRHRHEPAPYSLLFSKLPKARPVHADRICEIYSDRELRALVKYNRLREGDHSKIAKAKAVAAFFNSGQTGLSGPASVGWDEDGGAAEAEDDAPAPQKRKRAKQQKAPARAATAAAMEDDDGALSALLGTVLSRAEQELGQQQQQQQEQQPQPEVEWVQCEEEGCGKWRQLPLTVEAADLPDRFVCSMNHWSTEQASCEAAEEAEHEQAPLEAEDEEQEEQEEAEGEESTGRRGSSRNKSFGRLTKAQQKAVDALKVRKL